MLINENLHVIKGNFNLTNVQNMHKFLDNIILNVNFPISLKRIFFFYICVLHVPLYLSEF